MSAEHFNELEQLYCKCITTYIISDVDDLVNAGMFVMMDDESSSSSSAFSSTKGIRACAESFLFFHRFNLF